MSDEVRKADCGCGATSLNGQTTPSTSDNVGKVLQAKVAQSYNAKFNIRIVSARNLRDIVGEPPCRPRGNTAGWSGPSISPGLVATLAKADTAVIDWLARDKTNPKRFLTDPITALRDAGVDLERGQWKELARLKAAASATHIVPPGVTVQDVTAVAFPNGRVGNIGTVNPGGGQVGASPRADSFGCIPKRKG